MAYTCVAAADDGGGGDDDDDDDGVARIAGDGARGVRSTTRGARAGANANARMRHTLTRTIIMSRAHASTTQTTTRAAGRTRRRRARCVAGASRRALLTATLVGVSMRDAADADADAAVNARTTMDAIDVEFGLANNRIRACPREHNCVSTSARAAEQYASAWTAPSYLSAKDASEALIDAALDLGEDVRLIERQVIDGFGIYLRFACAGALGEDCVEFLVKQDVVDDRAWDGDAENGPLVLFRSFALDVKYVYPFMTPVSDLGAQGKRMEKIRTALGWKTLGCEVC